MIPIVVDHLWKFIFLHLKLNFSWNWCHLSLKIFEKFFFFLGMDWVNLVKLELTQQLKWNKGGGGQFFLAPSPLSSSFYFTPPSSHFFLPPLSVFTYFLHLHFLPHHTNSSLEITFLSFLTCFHSSPSIFFQIFVFLTIFATNPFLKPFSKPPFFFLCMTSSKGLSFLTFNGKKISPIPWMDWGRKSPPRPQDPCSTLHKGLQCELIFLFFFC